MNKIGGFAVLILVLFATVQTAAAMNATLYFNPQESTVSSYHDTTIVGIWLDVPAGLTVSYGQLGFDYTPACGNIIDRNLNTDIMTGVDPAWSTWNSSYLKDDCWDNDTDWVVFKFWIPKSGPIQIPIGNFTIQGNSTGYCISDLNFGWKSGCKQGDFVCLWDTSNVEVDHEVINGTFACGTVPSAEMFSKPPYEGWNLISLPLVPTDNSAGAVLSGVPHDAVYLYNATSKEFENADAMNAGVGYFVHATAGCTWKYNGTPYTSMSVPLETGLNMVGWLNCSKGVSDAFSIAGDYYYIASWNTVAQKFEVYNPVEPSFSGITTMDRGTGYFISAKQDCTISANC